MMDVVVQDIDENLLTGITTVIYQLVYFTNTKLSGLESFSIRLTIELNNPIEGQRRSRGCAARSHTPFFWKIH